MRSLMGASAPLFLAIILVYNLVFQESAQAKLPQVQSEKGPVIKLTAYCGCETCCGQWSRYNKTASGTTPVRFWTVAADTRIFRFGTILWVEGIGEVMVQDTGSAVKGLHLDVYHGLRAHREAKEFGVRYARFRVVHSPKGI